MPSLNQLPQKVQDAIARGRAIPLLLDYRPENLSGHALTVYGLIDGIEFEGTFCADNHKGTDWISVPLPQYSESSAPELKLDSEDATAVHEIWSMWHNSVRANYLRFIEVMAQVINQDRLLAALQSAEPVKTVTKSTGRPKKSTVRKAKASIARVRKSTTRRGPRF